MQRRRTIRDFSDRPVPRDVIEYCIRAAGTAPSGANLQPWHFGAVSGGEATDSDRSGIGGEGILRAACAESVAGSASTTGHGFEQALPGNCAVVNRRFCTTVSNSNGRKPFANLLRD